MFGMDLIEFHGGLGNQMFEYALFLNLKKHHPWRMYLLDIHHTKMFFQGYELPKLFKVRTAWRINGYRALRRVFPKRLKKMAVYQEKSPFLFEEAVFSQKAGTCYEGCWQSEKYFDGVEDKIRKAFAFDEKMLNTQTRELSKKIKSGGIYASIHIRRGDYIDEGRYLCTLDYYHEAVKMILASDAQTRFVVFSDDIEWVRESLNIQDAIYVDWNKTVDSWQDMYLMSICHHNIIANSTFSWWGAWLNNHKDKVVIAPPMWLEEETKNLDIIPITWRILENKK